MKKLLLLSLLTLGITISSNAALAGKRNSGRLCDQMGVPCPKTKTWVFKVYNRSSNSMCKYKRLFYYWRGTKYSLRPGYHRKHTFESYSSSKTRVYFKGLQTTFYASKKDVNITMNRDVTYNTCIPNMYTSDD